MSVATVWRSPAAPRPVDQPALAAPANIRGWLAAMSLADRRGLDGRADTQALLGERVVVLAERGQWAQVVVPDQPTPLAAGGYPGWIPVRQLSWTAPVRQATAATVVAPTVWLYASQSGSRLVEASFGTRLPVVHRDATWVQLSLPGGSTARVHAASVAIAPTGVAPLPATGAEAVRLTTMFLGLPYLWAGTSGFGFDCSGLTHLVHRVLGRTIPRDADAQAATGAPVARSALQPGDLVFFASGGVVHHVGMYAGSGMMLDSPQTGAAVERVSLWGVAYANQYSGARRYLR